MTDKHGNRNGYPQSHGDAPAFPVSLPGVGDNGWHGMSLRDWFAGQIVAAGYSRGGDRPEIAAEFAYRVADAMLAQRALPSGERADG